jgi:hypothetical protein
LHETCRLRAAAHDLGFGADEVGFAGGDSGGPLFIGGAIAGVHAVVAQPSIGDVNGVLDSSWGEGSFFTPVITYREFILKATGRAAIFVPEPSTVGPLVAVVAALVKSVADLNLRPAAKRCWIYHSRDKHRSTQTSCEGTERISAPAVWFPNSAPRSKLLWRRNWRAPEQAFVEAKRAWHGANSDGAELPAAALACPGGATF